MRAVISSQRLIDFWISEKDIHNRAEGVALGQELFATGVLRHGTPGRGHVACACMCMHVRVATIM